VNPFPDRFSNGDTEVVGSLGELIDELINLCVGFLISLTEGGIDTGPVVELYTGLSDLFDLEESILDMG